jgi:anti-sigma-K factor RskA
MTDASLTPHEEDSSLAGEYVLGVLDAADRAAVEARIRTDAAFAAEVAAWERRFEGMNERFADVPAPNLLPQIEARLFGHPAPRPSAMHWLARFLAGAGVAAAIALAAFVVLRPAPRPDGPVMTATLSAEDATLAFSARYQDGTLTVTRTIGAAAPQGQVHELWVIVGDAAPVSLGLLDQATFTRPLDALPDGAVLAVSLEPSGGSPTGAPTGPVLAAGPVAL